MRKLGKTLPYLLLGALAAPLQLLGTASAGVLDLFSEKPKEICGPFEITQHSSRFRVGDHGTQVTHHSYSVRFRGQAVRLAEPKSEHQSEPWMGKTFDDVYLIDAQQPVLLVELGYPSPWRRQYLLREMDGRLHTDLVFPDADNLLGEPELSDSVRRLDADARYEGPGVKTAEPGQLILRLRGQSPWLMAGLITVIDTRTLAIRRLELPDDSADNPAILHRSPDGNSFVRRAAFINELRVYDLPEGKLYTVALDPVLRDVAIEGAEPFDAAWFAHFFEWQPPTTKGGHYRLRARPGARAALSAGKGGGAAGDRD